MRKHVDSFVYLSMEIHTKIYQYETIYNVHDLLLISLSYLKPIALHGMKV